jgi:hypothetical protein
MLGHELDVPVLHPPVPGFVFDAEVGQFEMTSHHRQVVRGGECQALLHDVGVVVSTLAIQELLVVTLQLVVEDDPGDATAVAFDTGSFFPVDAIQPRVMPQLARLHDVGVVLLPVTTRSSRRVRVQEIPAFWSECDDMVCTITVSDRLVGQQPLLAEVSPIAVPNVLAVPPFAEVVG